MAGIEPAVRAKTLAVDKVRSLRHTSDLPEFPGKSLALRGDDGNRTPDQGITVLCSRLGHNKSRFVSHNLIVVMFLYCVTLQKPKEIQQKRPVVRNKPAVFKGAVKVECLRNRR
jgi:hypothetical protein